VLNILKSKPTHMTCYVHRDKNLKAYNFTDENAIFNYCQDPDHVGLEYLFRIVFHLENLMPEQNFKYIITGNLKELPEYGKHIIVLTMWDEWCRPPYYAHKVGYVLSTYGFRFENHYSKPFLSQYNAIKFFKTVWIQYNRLPYLLNYKLKTAFSKEDKNLLQIPLGYYKHEKVPFKSINDRPIDVHFAGSIYATGEKYKNPIAKFLKGFITSPRNYARQKLVTALTAIQVKYPQFSIVNRCFNGFAKGLNRYEYSLEMMHTKICLAPRGSSLETYRLFEAMRFGCVVIADKQPQKWYYDTVPAIFVEDWSELESIVTNLLEDPKQLNTLSQQSLLWWKSEAAPYAVATYIFDEINLENGVKPSVYSDSTTF
jgi:Glycosyl transferases group 1